jgi:branched-chain amino acid transport system substrate-binding protein
MLKKTWVIILGILVAISVVGGVWYYLIQTAPKGEIVIGGVWSLTGGSAAVGEYMHRGALLAVEELNKRGGILGRTIKYIYEDDASQPTTAALAYDRIVTQGGAQFVIGTTFSSLALAMMEPASKYKVLTLFSGAGDVKIREMIMQNPDKYKYVWVLNPNSTVYGPLWVEFIKDYVTAGKIPPKNKIIVVIREESGWAIGATDFLIKRAEQLLPDWEVRVEAVPLACEDFYPVLLKIKPLNPTAVIYMGYYFSSALALAKQYFELNIPALLCYQFIAGQPEFVKTLGVERTDYVVWGNYMGMPIKDRREEFVKKYTERFGSPPSVQSAMAYDEVMLLAKAIEKAGTLNTEDVIKALQTITYEGICGRYVFNTKTHDVIPGKGYIPALVYQFKGGESYIVWPMDYKEKEFELPPWVKSSD